MTWDVFKLETGADHLELIWNDELRTVQCPYGCKVLMVIVILIASINSIRFCTVIVAVGLWS